MIDKQKLAKFVAIVSRGGTVVCSAATRDWLMACAGDLSGAVWSDVKFRISPHMRDGQIAATTHDALSEPQELTDGPLPPATPHE